MKISEGAPPAPPQNNVVVEKTSLFGVQNKRRSFPDQANAPVPQTQKDKRDFTKSTLYSGGRGGRVGCPYRPAEGFRRNGPSAFILQTAE